MPTQGSCRSPIAVFAALLCVGRAQQPDPRPTFEVATVKPSIVDFNHCGGADGPAGPGRLVLKCATLENLIQQAYAVFANGISLNPQTFPISGAPAWLDSDHYDITAKVDANPRLEVRPLISPSFWPLPRMASRARISTARPSLEETEES